MNRHAVIRIVIALVWIVIGIIRLIAKDMTTGIVVLAVGIAFGVSAFMMLKKK